MSQFAIARTATIAASPEVVFALIQDLHEWEAWSPWQEIDPNMDQTYSGPDAGVGAEMEWSGNKDAGQGRMTVVTAEPDLVEIDIEFIKPFPAKNRSHFTIAGRPDGTEVRWTMTGTQNFLMKVMFTVFKMEQSIGADFERGLARLKAVAEAPNAVDAGVGTDAEAAKDAGNATD